MYLFWSKQRQASKGSMAQRLAVAFFLAAIVPLPLGAASSITADSRQTHQFGIVLLVLLAAAEAVLVGLLLHSRSKSKAAEAALQRKEEQLRRSEEMFSKAFREAPVSVTLTTVDGLRFIDVNETFERLTGYSRPEVLGRTIGEIESLIEPTELQELSQKLLNKGHLREAETRIRRKDGATRVVQASAELIDIGGERCVLGVAVDITDRKQTEQALIESERRFRLMADCAPVLMWLTGPEGFCIDVNKEWLRFTGRTICEELSEGWTQKIHPDDLQSFMATYFDAFRKKQSFTLEHRLNRFDGESRWMRNNAVPRFLGDGRFAGYIGCCVDITGEREAKAAREELGGRLIRAQEEERARIARELHDDINQRMALLANGLERKGSASGDLHNEEELKDLWKLTNEIATDIQQISHQLHPSKLQYLGLAAAVRELCREFSRQHNIEVDCNVRDLPRDLDEDISLSLFRTIQESLRNVAKHSHAHEISVELSCPDAMVRLRICDDGVGFIPELCDKSKGLGLVSMHERLRSAGGQLQITSHPFLGTQVEGTVPAILKTRRSELVLSQDD